MKTFYFMGSNPENISKVSWKIWRIERHGRKLTASWGPAALENRKVVLKYTPQSKSWTFPSEKQAIENEAARINEKLKQGYTRQPRRTYK